VQLNKFWIKEPGILVQMENTLQILEKLSVFSGHVLGEKFFGKQKVN
jgi:hypothetical protein